MKLETKIFHKQNLFTLDIELYAEFSFLGIFGPSGAGKSTLLNIISGLQTPQRGILKIDDELYFDSSKGVNLKAYLRKIPIVFQDIRLFPHLTVLQNIMFAKKSLDTPEDNELFYNLIHTLDLRKILKNYPSQISGGEAQRTALARALLSSPKLLLLDEPFSQLDCKTKENAINKIKEIRKLCKCPMIIVSHNPWDIVELCDKVIEMNAGKITRIRPINEFYNDENLICECKKHKNLRNLDIIQKAI